jgi:nucleoside-diphosphate-sugar epimerase
MTTKNDLFLITGATGKTGAHTVRLLRERGLRVRAFVHALDDRAHQLAEQGAEIVQGTCWTFPPSALRCLASPQPTSITRLSRV